MRRLTNKEFIEKSKLMHSNKYDYSRVSYLGSKAKVIILCKQHGAFSQTPNSHLKGRNCPECSSIKSATSIFIERANFVHNKKYDYTGITYINARTKINIKCYIHGEFKQIANNHLKGNGCPICRSSKGELKIIKLLKDNNIEYNPQYTYEDCRYKNKLPFDFYLPKYGICIEYNGEQHYQIIEGWGGIENYNLRKLRDEIKKEYCRLNNIPLIVISYKEIDNLHFGDIISNII